MVLPEIKLPNCFETLTNLITLGEEMITLQLKYDFI